MFLFASVRLFRAQPYHRPSEHTMPRDHSLLSVAATTALAATDPDCAERLARSIPDKHSKARALSGIATALAATSS